MVDRMLLGFLLHSTSHRPSTLMHAGPVVELYVSATLSVAVDLPPSSLCTPRSSHLSQRYFKSFPPSNYLTMLQVASTLHIMKWRFFFISPSLLISSLFLSFIITLLIKTRMFNLVLNHISLYFSSCTRLFSFYLWANLKQHAKFFFRHFLIHLLKFTDFHLLFLSHHQFSV